MDLMQLGVNAAVNLSHHSTFGYLFLLVTILALYRVYLYRDFHGRGKVVTIFYSLISFTSFARCIWFFCFSYSEKYFLPVHPLMFTEPGAGWCLLSESLTSLGSMGLYLIFILIACYWSQLLRDTSNASYYTRLAETDTNSVLNPFFVWMQERNLNMIHLFAFSVAILLITSLINILLFTTKVFNSEDMILYDSIELTIVSLITMLALTLLSRRIQTLLVMIGAINNSSTQAQIRRIVAITYAANLFFVARVSIEISFLIAILTLYLQGLSLSTLLLDRYWDVYVVLKYTTELAILVLELFISSAIKIYSADTNAGSGGAGARSANRRVSGGGTNINATESSPLMNPSNAHRHTQHYGIHSQQQQQQQTHQHSFQFVQVGQNATSKSIERVTPTRTINI